MPTELGRRCSVEQLWPALKTQARDSIIQVLLVLVNNPSLSVSANAYQYEKISFNNGAGEGEDLTSGQFNVVPTLISGMYRFEQSPSASIGYQIITRNRSTTSANARRDEVADVLLNPFAPGPEDYIGQYNYDTDLTEVWGGLSYAYKGWEKVSVGFTNFLSVRTQKLNESAQARAINRNTFVAGISDASTHYDYYNLRALWKAGIAADLDPLKVGFTVTTPSVGIVSAGTVSRDVTVVNVDINDDGFPDSFVADNRQNNLDAMVKSPASVGWGLEYAMSERTKLAAAAWFGAMGRYNVIEPESRDFLRPSGINLFDSKDFLAVTDAADDVFNWAVGIEHQFTDKDKGYFSIRSDYSSTQIDDSNQMHLGFSKIISTTSQSALVMCSSIQSLALA